MRSVGFASGRADGGAVGALYRITVYFRCYKINGNLPAMFETEEFNAQLRDTIIRQASLIKLERYEVQIVDFLQALASENEPHLMERELRKAQGVPRRGIPDALKSARELTMEAARYAVSDGRTLLKLSDIQQAYRAKFCQFWPFCK